MMPGEEGQIRKERAVANARYTDMPGMPPAEVLRRTTIELGPLRITREYRCLAPSPLALPLDRRAAAPRRGGWHAAAGMALLCTVGAGGLAVAATKAPARPSYSVSVSVPERVAEPARQPDVALRRSAIAPKPRAAATSPATTDEHAPASDASGFTSRASAIAAALRSGDMQEWHAGNGGEHGFVVAGLAEEQDGKVCRALSVLTRAAGMGDRVDQMRECRAPGS